MSKMSKNGLATPTCSEEFVNHIVYALIDHHQKQNTLDKIMSKGGKSVRVSDILSICLHFDEDVNNYWWSWMLVCPKTNEALFGHSWM